MFKVTSKETKKTTTTATRSAALIWATITANRIKAETGQKVRFKIIEE